MIFWSLFSAVVGVIAAIGLVACFSRTERSKSGNYNPQALSVIGSALLSTFILVTAFLIAGSWATYNADRQHTYDEARSASVAYWLAGKLPAADAATVRQGLTSYVDMVVKDEWPLMAKRQSSNPTWSELDQLRAAVAALHPADAAAEKKRADLAASLDDLYSKRSIRVADANYSMPGILYAALIIAALLLLAYPPLVGMTGNLRNVTLLAGFGAMIGLGIYIVSSLSHPFAQPLAVSPNAYRQALERFAQIASGSIS